MLEGILIIKIGAVECKEKQVKTRLAILSMLGHSRLSICHLHIDKLLRGAMLVRAAEP